jgi:hypothetical protein
MLLSGSVFTTGKWRSHQLPNKCKCNVLTIFRRAVDRVSLWISFLMQGLLMLTGGLAIGQAAIPDSFQFFS